MPDSQLTLGGPELPKEPPVGTARGKVLQMLHTHAWVSGIVADERGPDE